MIDSWLDDGFHFFVFQLDAEESPVGPETVALAVFAMHPEQVEPISAVTVIPTATGQHAEITDLREPGSSYVAPIHPEQSGVDTPS